MKRLISSIPTNRLLCYLSSLLLLPFLFLFCHFNLRLKEIDKVSFAFEKTAASYLEKEERQASNRAYRKAVLAKGGCCHEKAFDNHELLKKERSAIEQLMSQELFFGDPELEKRLVFLKNENRLQFLEQEVEVKTGVKETLFALKRKVEVDTADLKGVLSLIEFSYPQYCLTDFHLNKRAQEHGGNEVYLLDYKILKRDFL